MAFYRTPFILPLLYPSFVWRVPTDEKIIYLTFDDGPIPGPTEFVLEQLAKFNAKATFFCIGDNIRKHPDIFNKVITAGHAIGNHTYNHIKGWNHTTENYTKNVALCEEAIATVYPPTSSKLFRPPYGRIRRAQAHALSGYKIIMWDVLTQDYSGALTPDRCLAGTIPATRTGSVVLLHDSLKAEKNMKYVLPRFLDHFSTLGFSFKALSL